jgi:hypothetical protein
MGPPDEEQRRPVDADRRALAHERARQGLDNAQGALERMREALAAGRANLEKALRNLRDSLGRGDARQR